MKLVITTIEIPVTNLERSQAWYTDKLGLNQTWTDGESMAMFELPDAGSPNLFLVRTEDSTRLAIPNAATGVIHGVIDFAVEDIDAIHTSLRERGVDVSDLPSAGEDDGPGPRGFGFKDPDGNLFGVCQYGE